ncbi:sugar phosphate isomerase/epimerase, partial [Clostridioides difficile]
MKLGVFLVLFGGRKLEDALDYVASKGLKAVEIGTGGHPGNAHCKPDELLSNPTALKNFKNAVESRGLTISALSCHGNPLHPQKDIAKGFHDDFVKSVELAEKLEVPVV